MKSISDLEREIADLRAEGEHLAEQMTAVAVSLRDREQELADLRLRVEQDQVSEISQTFLRDSLRKFGRRFLK
jgi:predicted  nucleic acid-binding Zn-ribbon protein